MKKIALALVIASMVVAELILSGVNVVAGLVIIGVILLAAALMDYLGSERKRTTSITHAARRSRQLLISRRGSSYERQSWDGWQHCSQELQSVK